MSLVLEQHKGAVQPPRYVWTTDEIGSNELLFSEDFTEITGWSTTGLNVTENAATAPDGTNTMTTLEDPDTSFRVATSNSRSYTDDEVITGSLHFLKDAVGQATRYPIIRLFFTGGTSRYVDLMLDTSTGEILSDNPSGVPVIHDFGVEDVDDAGTHWRVWITASSASSHTGCYLALYPAVDSGSLGTPYTAGTTGACTVWGGQLNRGSLLPYVRTSGAVVSSGRNRVRSTTDWTPSDPVGNYAQTHDLTSAQWSKVRIVAATHGEAPPVPNAVFKSYSLTDGAGGGTSSSVLTETYQSTPSIGEPKLWSLYLKHVSGVADWAYIAVTAYGTYIPYVYFDLTNAAVGETSTDNLFEGIENVGGGWRRCWLAIPADTDNNWRPLIALSAGDGSYTNVPQDGTNSIAVAGHLFEDATGKTEPSEYFFAENNTTTETVRSPNNIIYTYKGAVQPTKLATGPYPGFTDAEYKMNKVKYARNVMRHTPRRRYR